LAQILEQKEESETAEQRRHKGMGQLKTEMDSSESTAEPLSPTQQNARKRAIAAQRIGLNREYHV